MLNTIKKKFKAQECHYRPPMYCVATLGGLNTFITKI